MKKFALALLAALPLFFGACNNEEEEPAVEDTNSYTLPILLWGGNQSAIQQRIPLSLNLALNEAQSDETQLLYYTIGTAERYPWYIYQFDDNALVASAMVVSLDDDEEFTKFIEKHYTLLEGTEYETEDNLIYADGKSLSEASVIVSVEPDFEDNNEMAIWQPITHTKSVGSLLNNDVMMKMRAAKKLMK